MNSRRVNKKSGKDSASQEALTHEAPRGKSSSQRAKDYDKSLKSKHKDKNTPAESHVTQAQPKPKTMTAEEQELFNILKRNSSAKEDSSKEKPNPKTILTPSFLEELTSKKAAPKDIDSPVSAEDEDELPRSPAPIIQKSSKKKTFLIGEEESDEQILVDLAKPDPLTNLYRDITGKLVPRGSVVDVEGRNGSHQKENTSMKIQIGGKSGQDMTEEEKKRVLEAVIGNKDTEFIMQRTEKGFVTSQSQRSDDFSVPASQNQEGETLKRLETLKEPPKKKRLDDIGQISEEKERNKMEEESDIVEIEHISSPEEIEDEGNEGQEEMEVVSEGQREEKVNGEHEKEEQFQATQNIQDETVEIDIGEEKIGVTDYLNRIIAQSMLREESRKSGTRDMEVESLGEKHPSRHTGTSQSRLDKTEIIDFASQFGASQRNYTQVVNTQIKTTIRDESDRNVLNESLERSYAESSVIVVEKREERLEIEGGNSVFTVSIEKSQRMEVEEEGEAEEVGKEEVTELMDITEVRITEHVNGDQHSAGKANRRSMSPERSDTPRKSIVSEILEAIDNLAEIEDLHKEGNSENSEVREELQKELENQEDYLERSQNGIEQSEESEERVIMPEKIQKKKEIEEEEVVEEEEKEEQVEEEEQSTPKEDQVEIESIGRNEPQKYQEDWELVDEQGQEQQGDGDGDQGEIEEENVVVESDGLNISPGKDQVSNGSPMNEELEIEETQEKVREREMEPTLEPVEEREAEEEFDENDIIQIEEEVRVLEVPDMTPEPTRQEERKVDNDDDFDDEAFLQLLEEEEERRRKNKVQVIRRQEEIPQTISAASQQREEEDLSVIERNPASLEQDDDIIEVSNVSSSLGGIRGGYSVYEDWKILEAMDWHLSRNGSTGLQSKNTWETMKDAVTKKRLLGGTRTAESMRTRMRKQLSLLTDEDQRKIKQFINSHSEEECRNSFLTFSMKGGVKVMTGITRSSEPRSTFNQPQARKVRKGSDKGKVERAFEQHSHFEDDNEDIETVEEDIFTEGQQSGELERSLIHKEYLKHKLNHINKNNNGRQIQVVQRPAASINHSRDSIQEVSLPNSNSLAMSDKNSMQKLVRGVPQPRKVESKKRKDYGLEGKPMFFDELQLKKTKTNAYFEQTSLIISEAFKLKRGQDSFELPRSDIAICVNLDEQYRQYVFDESEESASQSFVIERLSQLAAKYYLPQEEINRLFHLVSNDFDDLEMYLQTQNKMLLWEAEEDKHLLEDDKIALRYLKIIKGEERIARRRQYLIGD